MSAFTIDGSSLTLTSQDINKAFKINFNGSVNGGPIDSRLTSEAIVTFLGFQQIGTGSTAVVEANFQVALFNTSDSDIQSRVSSFGFDVDKTLIGIGSRNSVGNTRTSGLFGQDSSGQMANLGRMDVCFSAGNCSGGSNGGVTNFASTNQRFTYEQGEFSPTLSFRSVLTATTSITIQDVGVRYQSINGDQYRDASGTGVATGGSAYWTEIPEGYLF
ncbi:MAG: cistern family PEP-CTERM protein [Leptolyngbyaceae cyanobacterium bins.59]|nr:cistern family PEP-CTERM protein [Leptolyngbyaceae cyanobacterium bins.59]